MSFLNGRFLIRFLAVLQLMSAVGFMEGFAIGIQQAMSTSPNALTHWQLALGLFTGMMLILLNLLAGWMLIDQSRLGLQLSLVNTVAQVVALNLPFMSFNYSGIVNLSVYLNPTPASGLNIGFNFWALRNDFQLWFGQLPNRPMIAFSPVAAMISIYLFNRLRHFGEK